MKDILQTIKEMDRFKTLFSAIKSVNLSDTLSGSGPFTFFAPVEEAFKERFDENQKEILQNKWKLRQTLISHLMADRVCMADIENMGLAKMMNEKIFNIDVKNNQVLIDGARIIQGDILCSNGVIHAINALFSPG
jgi:uncharacterized surface protein with fasciclin (FAS1) repeats